MSSLLKSLPSVQQRLRLQPGYWGTSECLHKWTDEAAAEIQRLQAELRFAKDELECLGFWLDRALASDYRYQDDPALPNHRTAISLAVERLRFASEPR